MAILSRPDDPLLIIIRMSVILVSIFTVYTSVMVETSKRYILVSVYTAVLAIFTVVWANLSAFNIISQKLYDDWKYVAGACIYLAVIGKDIRYIHAAHLRRGYEKKISATEERLEKTASHLNHK